jgi:sugar-specific transcriptional regulator TrmB
MDQLKTLQKLGLTEYESRAYLALARLGPSTVREIVLESKLPRNKAYEALQKLEDKNKVVSLPISPKKFKINNPEIFRDEIKEMNNSVNELIKIVENPKVQEFRDLFWVIKGQKAIQEKLAVENSNVKKEILACNKLSRILFKNIRTMKDAVKRGVKVKMICTFDKSKIPVYKEWLNTGAEIRVFNEKMFGPLLPRIGIFDGIIARLTIGKPEVSNEEEYITLWTESKAFAQMLRNHFFNMWKNSKPIKEYLK